MSEINWWLKPLRGVRSLFVVILVAVVFACTDKKTEVPFVLELRAMPSSIDINGQNFYPKPFFIRAKYSDQTEKNISARVTWVSENLSLIRINKKGEIVKTGDCLLSQCVVSLIATDPESGKSLRLTVNINQKKDQSDSKVEKRAVVKNETMDVIEHKDDLSEETPDANNDEMVVTGIAFSPLAGALDVFNGRETMFKESQKSKVFISKLMFEEAELTLASGDVYSPPIVAIDSLGQRHLDYEQAVVCYTTDTFTLSIVVLPGCQLIAGEPGSAEVGIEFADGRDVDTERLMVRVTPLAIDSLPGGFSRNVNFSKNHVGQWFHISGLDSSSYYRVVLSGNLSLGHHLSVFTRPESAYPTCVNTVPIGSNMVACYFQTLQSDVVFSIQNFERQAAQFTLKIESVASELFLGSEALNSQTPAQLTLGNPASAFVFANKVGGNSLHQYIFLNDDPVHTALRVRLLGYTAQVKLNIRWANGWCNERMLTYAGSEAVCLIPDYVSGEININIDGNNGEFGVLSGPVAAFGGTFYTLVVDSFE